MYNRRVFRFENLEVMQLVRRFGRRYALRGVSATFAPGTISVIEGSNGAGKSTFLNIVATLLSATSGEVHYRPLASGRVDRVRAQLGWVSHDALCYRALSARENVELAAKLQGMEATRAFAPLAAALGMEAFGERPVEALSRGQRQRVALARALVHHPAALLLDEPSTGLDEDGRNQLVRVLLEQRARGVTVLLATHSRELMDRVGDRRLRFEAGRIVSDLA